VIDLDELRETNEPILANMENELCENCEQRVVEHSQGFITCVPSGYTHYYEPSFLDDKMLFYFTSLPRSHSNATLCKCPYGPYCLSSSICILPVLHYCAL